MSNPEFTKKRLKLGVTASKLASLCALVLSQDSSHQQTTSISRATAVASVRFSSNSVTAFQFELEITTTTMHSFDYRANALLTFAITILALMCAVASISDNFKSPSPSAQVQLLSMKPKNALNQISLWDGIIPSKDHAKFWIHTSNKYSIINQGSNLRGKDFNLTMHWHVMHKTGKMFADKIVMPGYRLL